MWLPDAEVAPRATPMDIASSTGITNGEGPSPMDEDAGESSLPFGVFDDVSEGSPAAMDGVKVGDQLVRFGSVDGGDNLLMRLAREGQANEGIGIPVVVLRRGERVHFTVTPRRWSGRGLLGYGPCTEQIWPCICWFCSIATCIILDSGHLPVQETAHCEQLVIRKSAFVQMTLFSCVIRKRFSHLCINQFNLALLMLVKLVWLAGVTFSPYDGVYCGAVSECWCFSFP